eukprot:scpid24472/ scgid5103/ Glutaminase liver isoform, mitochondrial; L-glutaminase; L-glutamine amidohydrolase
MSFSACASGLRCGSARLSRPIVLLRRLNNENKVSARSPSCATPPSRSFHACFQRQPVQTSQSGCNEQLRCATDISSPDSSGPYGSAQPMISSTTSDDEFSIFEIYCNSAGQFVIQRFLADVKAAGLFYSDPRLKEVMQFCRDMQEESGGLVPFEEFKKHAKANLAILHKALLRKMIIPEWEEFSNLVRGIFQEVKGNESGQVNC